MGTITDNAADAFRDYETDGVPATGAHEPEKADIRAIFALIEQVMGTLSLGSVDVTKDTRANLNADLNWAADSIGLVYADATDANNDLYVKVGGSGAGSWTLTTVLHDIIGALGAEVLQAYVDDAEAAAATAENAAASMQSAIAARYGITWDAGGGVMWDPKYWETTFFQDAAATTPVTADGDPVGCVKNIFGDDSYDLIQETNGERPTFRLIDGVPQVFADDGEALYTRENHTFSIPCWMVAGLDRPSSAGGYFGIFKRAGMELYFLPSTLGTEQAYLNGTSPSHTQKFITTPQYSAQPETQFVLDVVAKGGLASIKLNGGDEWSTLSPVSHDWVDGETVATTMIGLNISNQDAVDNTIGDPLPAQHRTWFGGAVLFQEPDATLRASLVDYFRRQLEPEIRRGRVLSTRDLVGGSGGTNGTFAIAFSGGGGNGAAGTFTVSGGAVTAISITEGGSGYTSAPTMSFANSAGLTGASATAVIRDKVILIIGDSTSDDVDTDTADVGEELFWRWASEATTDYLPDLNPDASIFYANYASRAQEWTGWRKAATGAGDERIFVFNASVPGSQPAYHLAGRLAALKARLPHVDEIGTNHGHNMFVAITDNDGVLRRGEWMSYFDQARQLWPDAAHIAIRTHPNGTIGNESILPVVEALDAVAALYGDVELVDIYDHFDSNGRPAGWYNGDKVHLDIPDGVDEQLVVWVPGYAGWTRPAEVAPPIIGRTSSSLVDNPLFDAFDSAAPDDWTFTETGDGACTKSVEQVDPDHDDLYSVKLTQTTGASYLEQSFDVSAYQSGYAVVAVRQYLAAGGSSNSGRIAMGCNGTGGVAIGSWVYDPATQPADGWRTVYHVMPVPADGTLGTLRLYAAASGVGTAYYGRAVVVGGQRPRDIR